VDSRSLSLIPVSHDFPAVAILSGWTLFGHEHNSRRTIHRSNGFQTQPDSKHSGFNGDFRNSCPFRNKRLNEFQKVRALIFLFPVFPTSGEHFWTGRGVALSTESISAGHLELDAQARMKIKSEKNGREMSTSYIF
jgi:hypothetical protein